MSSHHSGTSKLSGNRTESSHKGERSEASTERIRIADNSSTVRSEAARYEIREAKGTDSNPEKEKYAAVLSASPEARKQEKRAHGTERANKEKGLKTGDGTPKTDAGKTTEKATATGSAPAGEIKIDEKTKPGTDSILGDRTKPDNRTGTGIETDIPKEHEHRKGTTVLKETDERTIEEQKAAMAEIKLKEFSQEELDRTAEDNERQFFRNGEGKTISYSEAHQEILTDVSDSLDRLRKQGRDIPDEQREAILKDVNDTLLKQQAESTGRAIGNHGITHIYGNYERMKDIPDEVLALSAEQMRERDKTSETTADDVRLGMILAAVYHDEGYLSERANKGVNHEADDSLHGIDSAIAFENSHRKHLDGAVDGSVLTEVTQAMAEHNLLSSENVKKVRKAEESGTPQPARMQMLSRIDIEKNSDLDPNSGLIRSSLLISDKVALDADEKVPDVLRKEDTAAIVAEYYTKDRMGLYTRKEKETYSEEMRGRMRAAIDADPDLSDSQKERYRVAVGKDISIGSGEFDMPLAGAAVSRDAVRFRVVTDTTGTRKIHADVTIEHRINDQLYEESFMSREVVTGDVRDVEPSPAAKKIRGAMKDFGVLPKETAHLELAEQDETEKLSALIPDGDGRFAVRTDDIQGLENVSIVLQDVQLDNPKVKISEYEQTGEETVDKLSYAALEYREAEMNARVRQSFKGKLDRGTVTTNDILNMCSAAYETSPDQTIRILSQLDEVRLMDDSPEKTRLTRQIAQQAWETLEVKKASDVEEKLKKGGAGV